MSGAEIATLVTALAALAGVIVQAYRTRGDARKSRLDSEVTAASALGKLLDDFNRLREELETSRDENEDAYARLDTTRAELAEKTRELATALSRIEELERELRRRKGRATTEN